MSPLGEMLYLEPAKPNSGAQKQQMADETTLFFMFHQQTGM